MRALTLKQGALTLPDLIRRLSLLSGILGAAAFLAVITGTDNFKFNDLYQLIKGFHKDSIQSVIFWEVRLPRAILAAAVGGALGICGAVLQTLLRNPLAEPFLLGISSGAAIGAYAAILLGFQFSLFGFSAISVLALLGGLAAIALVYRVACVGGRLPTLTLILAGVVVNAMFSSVILFANSVFEAGRVMTVMSWLLGHISGLEKPTLALVVIFIFSASALLFLHARHLNGMVLGEGPAQSLGIPAEALKKRLLVITTALT
ncbi:MAG TPA: iron chelate uptake ABC transporter family permease subunit, partial [Nitrospiria bacterium]